MFKGISELHIFKNLNFDTVVSGGFHRSVDVSQDVVTKHCYWPIFSDFLNLMAHQSVVKYFFSRTALVEKYSSIVECFSAMNPHKRAIDEHVQFENSLYITAFSVEIETCSAPLWSFVSHIESQVGAIGFHEFCSEVRRMFLSCISKAHNKKSSYAIEFLILFHLPLFAFGTP